MFLPLFAFEFVASFVATGIYMYGIAVNNNIAADLIGAIVLAIFFGSDMFIAGGIVYLINNFAPTPDPTPTNSQYILIGKDNKPIVVNGEPSMLPVMDRAQPVVMV